MLPLRAGFLRPPKSCLSVGLSWFWVCLLLRSTSSQPALTLRVADLDDRAQCHVWAYLCIIFLLSFVRVVSNLVLQAVNTPSAQWEAIGSQHDRGHENTGSSSWSDLIIRGCCDVFFLIYRAWQSLMQEQREREIFWDACGFSWLQDNQLILTFQIH